MRLNRYVAAGSGLSRRAADVAVTAGRVRVNGQLGSLGIAVEDGDTVTLDGLTLSLPTTFRYVALNKPAGYISSRTRQGRSPIVYDLLSPADQDLRLAGRLDQQSSGLVLLSNDGDFINRMSHPSADKLKVYEVDVDRTPKAEHLAKLERGIELADGNSRMSVQAVDGHKLTLALSEGRSRQIRRTLGALGYGITRLHRVAIGDYELGDLQPGQWREVSA